MDIKYAALFGAGFGIVGILIIFIFSRKNKKMMHCVTYCPIGTIVNYLKFVNPFRLKIDDSCTMCAQCIPTCKYDALNLNNLKNKRAGLTCTLCGDCLHSCHASSIRYQFLNLSANTSRNLYLVISVSLYAIFLALGKI